MEDPIRILHVLGGLDQGGAEVMVMNLYRNIDRNLVQFEFVVHTTKHGYFENEIIKMGGVVHRVPRFKGYNILSYRRAWKKMFSTDNRFLAVHGHIGSSAAIYLKVANQYGLTTIAHSHGAGNTRDLKGLMYDFFSFPTRYIADYFFACSKAAGLSRFGTKVVNSSRFSIVRNAMRIQDFGFDMDVREITRKAFSLEGKFVVGHVGRFDPLKNHRFLLGIYKELHKLLPDSILLLVGDGEERTNIEQELKRLGITDSVILMGARSDIPELLQAMDVFVFPSIAEGLGISLIEAQATGLPCVVSSNVPFEAAITDLVTFKSLKNSITEWVSAIMETRSPGTREGHLEELVESGYDITLTVRQIQAFYLALRKEK